MDAPLAGVFGFAPWVNYAVDGASMSENRDKDMIPKIALVNWSRAYLGGDGKEGDEWSEPDKAPLEWWTDASEKTAGVLFLAGKDEILFSAIDAFVKKVKVYSPPRYGGCDIPTAKLLWLTCDIYSFLYTAVSTEHPIRHWTRRNARRASLQRAVSQRGDRAGKSTGKLVGHSSRMKRSSSSSLDNSSPYS